MWRRRKIFTVENAPGKSLSLRHKLSQTKKLTIHVSVCDGLVVSEAKSYRDSSEF